MANCRVLAIVERSFGPDHPIVATGLNNLAGLLRVTNRRADAEPLYRWALAIRREELRAGSSQCREGPQQPRPTADRDRPPRRGGAAVPPGSGDQREELWAGSPRCCHGPQ